MKKRTAIYIFLLTLIVNFIMSPTATVHAVSVAESGISVSGTGNTGITSSYYGTKYKGNVTFDSETCKTEYAAISDQFAHALTDEEVELEDSGFFAGIFKKIMDFYADWAYQTSEALTTLLLATGCEIGIAPSQFMQIMFFPVNLDGYMYLNSLTPLIQTLGILILLITTVMAILEMNNKRSSFEEELISKIGLFLVAVGFIAFSKFILSGIYDIANIIGYFISNYKVDIHLLIQDTNATITTNLLNFPSLFVQYVGYAFTPKLLMSIPGVNQTMILILFIIKIVVLFFITKDLLKIAVYGIKRLVTLVSAAVVLPILAALIPSNQTRDIFYRYFRQVIASAVAPVIFGLIFLASTIFVLEDLVDFNGSPLPSILKVLIIAFFLNIMSSIPEFVDGLIGTSGGIGAGGFERSMSNFSWGPAGQKALGSYQNFNRHKRAVKIADLKSGGTGKAGIGQVMGSMAKSSAKKFQYGTRKR